MLRGVTVLRSSAVTIGTTVSVTDMYAEVKS